MTNRLPRRRPTDPTTLAEPQWRARADAHRRRLQPFVEQRLTRRAAQQTHPVDDFLFDYYRLRPAQLLVWHPGVGVRLAGDAEEYLTRRGYVATDGGVTVDPFQVPAARTVVAPVRRLLAATAERRPQWGCFGLHEWAMVYRQPDEQRRHARWPLRVSDATVTGTVEAVGLRCTHFDAHRFFTEPAAARNQGRPRSDDRADWEQPGCLHATMDLYKHAFRLLPLLCSDLVADAFELAVEVRRLDMAASPYDLQALGVDPVAIESPAGRDEYVTRQQQLTERGAALRRRLLAAVEDVAARVADGSPGG